MDYFFELSKEYENIATSEILACLKATNISYTLLFVTSDCLGISTTASKEKMIKIAKRLSCSFALNTLLFYSPPDRISLLRSAEKKPLTEKGSIAIRYRNRSLHIDSGSIIKELASFYTLDRKVSLRSPDIELRALITSSNVYVGRLLYTIDRGQFERRKAQHRPFFSPISLHPKVARALVNLSEIQSGQLMYDPFCGTGGILIEAGLIGACLFGSDISAKMIQGAKENLTFYNLNAEQMFSADIGEIHTYLNKSIDAVVTDLPYGKATTTLGESLTPLYLRAFESISKVLKPGGKAVLGLPDKTLIKCNDTKKHLNLERIYPIPVHRSLTRYFCVFEKQP
ncbi:MAG: TRM11 family methyltransferase [Candidatus Thermoplasmatota archaeon]|nr:TRM11 family methyltransferase [Candidatus Thermoplasmatota archaeon]